MNCPECDADWSDGQTCTDCFHLLLGWEHEYQLPDVHHLLVLCYHLQHPSLYSPTTLAWGKRALARFLEEGVTPQALRREMHPMMDSGKRNFKITGTPESHGAYAHPVVWTMTVHDVVQGGPDHYYANVRAWAESILQSLRASGNLA